LILKGYENLPKFDRIVKEQKLPLFLYQKRGKKIKQKSLTLAEDVGIYGQSTIPTVSLMLLRGSILSYQVFFKFEFVGTEITTFNGCLCPLGFSKISFLPPTSSFPSRISRTVFSCILYSLLFFLHARKALFPQKKRSLFAL
jgi:hypothetical protein